jgi:hypothetical protein
MKSGTVSRSKLNQNLAMTVEGEAVQVEVVVAVVMVEVEVEVVMEVLKVEMEMTVMEEEEEEVVVVNTSRLQPTITAVSGQTLDSQLYGAVLINGVLIRLEERLQLPLMVSDRKLDIATKWRNLKLLFRTRHTLQVPEPHLTQRLVVQTWWPKDVKNNEEETRLKQQRLLLK